MSTQIRALLIAMFGPAIALVGVLWVLVSVAIDAGHELTLRYVIFNPGHLVILVGIAVTVVSAPVALAVAVAAPEDVELELIETQPAEQPAAESIPIAPGHTLGPAR